MRLNLIPLIATAAMPTAPNTGLPTANPTMPPKTPKHIATINTTFRVELPPDDRLVNWYPHEGQLSAVLEMDLLHSGQSISAIFFLLSLANVKGLAQATGGEHPIAG